MRRRSSLHTSSRSTDVDLPLSQSWAVVASGREGQQWYVDALPWLVRGAIDRAFGGAGRRWPPPGRELLRAGDTVGFWRVVECGSTKPVDGSVPGRRLVLDADVRAPGLVTLRTTLTPLGGTRCRVHQGVTFAPSGLLGVTYLLADLPAREVVMDLAHRRLLAALRARR